MICEYIIVRRDRATFNKPSPFITVIAMPEFYEGFERAPRFGCWKPGTCHNVVTQRVVDPVNPVHWELERPWQTPVPTVNLPQRSGNSKQTFLKAFQASDA